VGDVRGAAERELGGGAGPRPRPCLRVSRRRRRRAVRDAQRRPGHPHVRSPSLRLRQGLFHPLLLRLVYRYSSEVFPVRKGFTFLNM